jgi:hypothetical protein
MAPPRTFRRTTRSWAKRAEDGASEAALIAPIVLRN